MNLYCVEFTYNGNIVDVQCCVAKDNQELHRRLDKTIEECKEFDVDINGYNFCHINSADGYEVKLEKSE